jgi:peptidoglycan/xylan/chitin deacetylase (PgdA/CDA1 family)
MFIIDVKQRTKRAVASAWGRFAVPRGGLSLILNYHSVRPAHAYATTPADFRAQLSYLKNNFSVISLSEFHALRSRGIPLPAKSAVITFDDGFQDNYQYAYPVLRELGFPATIFLATGFINGEVDITRGWQDYCGLDPLKWSQILEMSQSGIGFGAHTHTHPILTAITLDEAEAEIVRSKTAIAGRLGSPPQHFAFPQGQPRAFNPSIIRLLEKHGFQLACSTIWGTSNADTDLFSLHRVRIDACDTFGDFVAKVNGSWNFIGTVQRLRG